jgi:hypothetical protein
MSKVVFMIDGWFMRKRVYQLKTFFYNGPNIRNYCMHFLSDSDALYRINENMRFEQSSFKMITDWTNVEIDG